MPCPGDDAGGCSRLLRLIGRYVGYHPAVVEQVCYQAASACHHFSRAAEPTLAQQVLEALSLSEHPAAIIEVLPLLVVGAGSKEVTRVAESLQVGLVSVMCMDSIIRMPNQVIHGLRRSE